MRNQYVEFRAREWSLDQQPRPLQRAVRRVLNELCAEGLFCLKDQRFEVIFTTEKSAFAAWSYFPMYSRRHAAKEYRPRPQTRVLLVIAVETFKRTTGAFFADCLRDALGHALLYLRSPKARNECKDAMREWHDMTSWS